MPSIIKQPTMRALFCLFVFFLTLTSNQEKSTETELKNYTTLNLSFIDFDPDKHKSFINIKIENGLNPIEQQLKISDGGKATFSAVNDEKREIILNYENRTFSLIISPNEILNMELAIADLSDWESKLEHLKITSGENAITNNLILKNTFYLDSLINSATKNYTRNSESTNDLEYKNKRIASMQKHLSVFEKYISDNNINDKSFIDWGTAKIKYAAGSDLLIYPFYGPTNRAIDDENEYFNFIEEVFPRYDYELTYHSYLKYLEWLSMAYTIMSNISNTYSTERELLRNKKISNFPIAIKMLKKFPENTQRELTMAYLYKKSERIPETYKDSLSNFVGTDLASQVTFKRENITQNIVTLIKNYDIPKDEKDSLLELYQNTEGKLIYHDFWFTNCAPCMIELPNYNDLIALTNQKDVEFIFYGANMPNEEWSSTVDKFKLKGKHHLLTKNQMAFFEKYFGLYAFPHHQIIKSNGQIGDKVDYLALPKNFDNINKLIDKHYVPK